MDSNKAVSKERLKILNVWVDPICMEEALQRAELFLSGDRARAVFAVNPEKSFSALEDPLLQEILRSSDLLIPDGIGIVMAARILYGAELSRVPGVELMDSLCGLASRKGESIFIYGAKEEVNAAAARALKKKYPELRIAGRSHGYVPEEEMGALIERINRSGAGILFLALGSPKQEKWFARHRDALERVRICQGIGGTLDTIAGNVRRAPSVWRAFALEWLYRLLSEPSRLRRQRVLPLFAWKVLATRLNVLS